jgi:hypothetical protein
MSILVTYPIEEGSDFLDAFASSGAVTVSFQTGNEPPWSIKMAGSHGAVKAFRSCVDKLIGEDKNKEATSPVTQAPTSHTPEEASTSPDAKSRV